MLNLISKSILLFSPEKLFSNKKTRGIATSILCKESNPKLIQNV